MLNQLGSLFLGLFFAFLPIFVGIPKQPWLLVFVMFNAFFQGFITFPRTAHIHMKNCPNHDK